jgi:hypothetical protein
VGSSIHDSIDKNTGFGLPATGTNPNTQFLLCLKAYVNKAGKSARLTSYCGEPFPLSALNLKKSVLEHLGAWLVQAYLPNLEAGSSAK